jgi:hypothetical protein
VESNHARPVDSLISDQSRQEFILARRGGENDSGIEGGLLSLGDRSSDPFGGGPSHPGPIFVDDDPERVDRELQNRPGFGGDHW